MSLLGRISTALSANESDEPTGWQLVLICADGLPEVQGYNTEQEAKDAGREQVGTGDGDCKVTGYHVRPINAHAIARGMVASAQ